MCVRGLYDIVRRSELHIHGDHVIAGLTTVALAMLWPSMLQGITVTRVGLHCAHQLRAGSTLQ